MIDWPETIIEDIARRRCVLFLGSGVSCNSMNADKIRPKTWAEVLTEGCNKLGKPRQQKIIKRQISANNYLMACELLKQFMGRDAFVNFISDEYLAPRFEVADIHKHIFSLDSRIVITPNFDNIYDTYVMNETKGTTKIKHYDDSDVADVIRKSDYLILKIHGDIQTPDKLIFSKNDYAKARNDYRHFYKVLESLLLTHTFIFIGAGLNDPDIQLLLEDYHLQYAFKRKHVFIIPKKQLTQEEKKIYTDSLHLQFLEYDSKSDHKELMDSIIELKNRVDDKRTQISRANSW